MPIRSLAVAAALGSIMSLNLPAVAGDGRESAAPADSGGWRPARRSIELLCSQTEYIGAESDDGPRDLATAAQLAETSFTQVSGQSPDDDFDMPVSMEPNWTYPSRRPVRTVPVPSYQGGGDMSRSSRQSDRLALNAYGSGRTSGRSDYYDAYQPPRYDSPPPLPTYRGQPALRDGPSCPLDPPPCSPCQENFFDDPCARACDGGYRYTWDNIYFFALADAFRLAGDHTRAGGRFGLNWGLPLIDDESGIGVQFGLAGDVVEEGPQWFATGGVFYRGDMRLNSAWNVGGVFDWMHDDEVGAGIGQVRAKTSITIDRQNEFGVWAALSLIDDDDTEGHKAETVNQANLFYRFLFDSGTDMTISLGWRDQPDSIAIGTAWSVPINDFWAGVFGGYYAFHGDTWNVWTGVVRQFGPRAHEDYIGQHRHQPYLPVADNFSMTLFHR